MRKVILIDYENIQPDISAFINDKSAHLFVFVGSQQGKINFSIAADLQKMGIRGEYVKVSSASPNALDFHIAYYIGVVATQHPDSRFYIISKDKGFDPLIMHLKEKKIQISQLVALDKIAAVAPKAQKKAKAKIDIVIEDLKNRTASRPKTLKTLTSTINAMFQKKLPAKDTEALIDALKRRKYIEIKDEKVSYKLPS